ncbi:hypothetical protein HY415_02160 [Candidatus Kaiserbacteria bacterium]|nr:hypothetical protein [Candidatus Kaiserbacteria bacterium]
MIGSCPTVFEKDPVGKEGDLIIVGFIPTSEELNAVAHGLKSGEEVAVRVPKSLIAGLKF